jgi:hypothetical protein
VGETLFDKYAPIFCSPTPPVVRDERLLIDEQGAIKIYYAPFEYTNRTARVVLVGITPGPTQMVNANNEARRALMSGKSSQDTMRAAKDTAAFSGEPMRGRETRATRPSATTKGPRQRGYPLLPTAEVLLKQRRLGSVASESHPQVVPVHRPQW